MRIFLAIAWRNVMRNKKRSFITIFAIAFGLIFLIFMWSIIDGVYPVMIDNMTGLFMGHMEVSTPEFVDRPALENAIRDGDPVIAAVRDHPNVEAYSPRMRLFGLLSYAENSQGGVVIGIDPELERELGRLDDDEFIIEGRFITSDDVRGAVIGATLAKNLDARLGERIFFLTQGPHQELAYTNLNVIGILKSHVPEIDGSMVFVRRADLTDADVLDMPGAVTDVAIRLRDQNLLEETKAELQSALEGHDEQKLVRTWKEIVPWIEQALAMDEAFFYFIVLIMFTVVVAGILNTVLMSVMERTREFGIMRALGTKGWQIATVVSLESVMLGVIGLVIGATCGIVLTLILGQTGLDLYSGIDESFMGEFYFFETRIYPLLNLDHFITTCIAVMVMIVLVSLYPARKAAKLEPVVAIKALG